MTERWWFIFTEGDGHGRAHTFRPATAGQAVSFCGAVITTSETISRWKRDDQALRCKGCERQI